MRFIENTTVRIGSLLIHSNNNLYPGGSGNNPIDLDIEAFGLWIRFLVHPGDNIRSFIRKMI